MKIFKISLITAMALFCFLILPMYAFATAYSVTGTLTPNATTSNTGEPVGTEQGQPYWDWDTDGPDWTKWRLCKSGFPDTWVIIPRDFTEDPGYSGFLRDFGDLSYIAPFNSGFWMRSSSDLLGDYAPQSPATGVATVAEYIANTIPNAPTLVSPADASSTIDTTPTLSANYSDPDTGDVGATNYRIATSAVNCTSGTTVASGTSSVTSDENEDTTWTPSSSIGDDGIYYWCAQNDDQVAQSSWTSMGSFTLDTTDPTANAGSDQTKHTQFTQTGTAEDLGSGIASYLWEKQSGTGTITFGTPTQAQTTVTADTDGTFVIKFTVIDQAGNSGFDTFTLFWQSEQVSTIAITGGGNAGQSFARPATNQNTGNNQYILQEDPRIKLIQRIIELLTEIIRILMIRKGLI